MPTTFWHITILAVLCCTISGCGGPVHVEVDIPPLEVSGTVVGKSDSFDNNPISIVVTTLYGESYAFLSLVNENLADSFFYQWKEIYLTKDGIVGASFEGEHRYVGSRFPFSPSQETIESRTLFLWIKDSQVIYKIVMYGTDASVLKTNIIELKESLPSTLRGATESQPGTFSEKQTKDLFTFYNRAKWRKTNILKVNKVFRSIQIDKLEIEIKLDADRK